MPSSVWQSFHLKIVGVVLTGAVAFSLLVLVYNSDVTLPNFGASLVSERNSQGQTNCSSPPKTDFILLIWMWPFGLHFDLSCDVYGITGCVLTDNKAVYPDAHAVMFHHRDIHSDLNGMPAEPRPSFQKWVWFNMESPANCGKIPPLNNLFNLTCTYRLDSDVPVPYGSLVPVSDKDELFTRIPTKDKLVCWIVSNWNSRFKRVQYYNELKKNIEIKTYGKAFGQYISDNEFNKIMSSCKFYLSFENSIFKDYITEKLYNPMRLGAVPVVLGPSRENYERFIPGDAFIHVDDFASPKELAERLKYLDEHPDEYMNYFEWRNTFKVVGGSFGQEHACRACSYLKTQRRYQTFRELNKWYWD